MLVIDVSAPISYIVEVNFYYLFRGDPFTTHTGFSYLRNIGSEGFSLSEVVLRVIRLATSIYVVSIASSGFLEVSISIFCVGRGCCSISCFCIFILMSQIGCSLLQSSSNLKWAPVMLSIMATESSF